MGNSKTPDGSTSDPVLALYLLRYDNHNVHLYVTSKDDVIWVVFLRIVHASFAPFSIPQLVTS